MGLAPLIVVLKLWRCAREMKFGPLGAILGEDFRDQLRTGGGHRDPHGISIRNDWSALFESSGRSDRPDVGDGRSLFIFSRVFVSWDFFFSAKNGWAAVALGFFTDDFPGIVAFRIFHRGDGCMEQHPVGYLLGPEAHSI